MTRRQRPLRQLSPKTRWLLPLALLACALPGPALADEEQGWPREIQLEKAEIVVYQPQLESFEGNQLRGRAAVSVRMAEGDGLVFGTAWIEARVDTDFDTRLVTLRSISVPRVRFAEATAEQQARLVSLLEEHIPTWELEMSLDRLLAGMEEIEQRAEAGGHFQDAPPVILFTETPTVLVSLDGEPRLWPINYSTLQSVVNSPFFIVQDRSGGPFYLYAGNELWYTANEIEGDWTVASEVPDAVKARQPEEEPAEADELDPERVTGDEGAQPGDDTPPAILVATQPTELIVTDGKPSYKPLGEGELLYVDNTEGDVLLELSSQRHFVLIGGRWFSARSLEGPWTFVAADALPQTFAGIPEDSDMGHVLAWVAGTEMAREVAADAYVPQTSAIRRDASIQVIYDGQPAFEEIEGTTLLYAVNTEFQVIQVESGYYCAHEGAWYFAQKAKGPWGVATEVPEEIQDIPASSPVYNTKYVYIFETTPEVVYVGYYPGYTHCYWYHGCLVYGTGWWYRPYWRSGYYYPRHRTWGFHVRYNPWGGWSFGLSWSRGPFTFTLGRAGLGGWCGPGWRSRYRRGYRHGYDRGWQRGFRQGARAGYAAGKRSSSRNLYIQRSNRARNASSAQARAGATRPGGSTPRTGGNATGPSSRARPTTSRERNNNVYADRDGRVHRRNSDGSWEGRENGTWKQERSASAQRSGAGRPTSGGQRPGASSSGRPTTRSQPTRQASGRSSLDRSHQSRQRGTQRTQASRGAPRRPVGGGRR